MSTLIKSELIQKIDEILPQTQCTRCGYPSCMEYAKALADESADINQCPPGGDDGINKLANLLNKPVKPLNPENGKIGLPKVALIDEDVCIGCTLCIKACPVDAILGSNKMMHTVIESECSGCDLCISVCPVDCISMVDAPYVDWTKKQAVAARERFNHHNYRKDRDMRARELRLQEKALRFGDAAATKSDILEQILAKMKTSKI